MQGVHVLDKAKESKRKQKKAKESRRNAKGMQKHAPMRSNDAIWHFKHLVLDS
jgi:hypothetical protein